MNERRAAWLMVAGAAAMLALATLVGVNLDEDELGTSVLMTTLQAQALWHGHLPFWSSRLGFGIPLPGAQSFLVHPLMPLFAWCDPYTAVTALYAAHIAAGAIGFWWLCRAMKLSPATSGACAATFLLASPSLRYTMTAFYPTHFVAWTVAPLVLALIIRMLSDDVPDTRIAIGLGLCAGVMLVDGHLGHAPFLLFLTSVGALAYPSRVRARARWLLLAVGIALAIGSFHIASTFDEYLRFPRTLPRWDDEMLRLPTLWDVFLRPLSPELMRRLRTGAIGEPSTFLLWRGAHVVFFGGPFAILAIVCLARRTFEHRWRPLLAVSVGSCVLLTIVSARWGLFALSATFLLSDAIVIAGIALAGIALDHVRYVTRRRTMYSVLVAAQLAVMVASAGPFVFRSVDLARSPTAAGEDESMRPLTERIPALTAGSGRVYMTSAPPLWDRWGLERPELWHTRLTAAGVRMVNGLYKGISTEPFTPSTVLPYGLVDGSTSLAMSSASLTALGIRAVLALESEPVSSDLVLVDSWPMPPGRLRLLDNPRAWPGAHFVAAGIFATDLPLLTGCPHTRLLCRDLTPVVAAAEEPVDDVRADDGTIRIRFAPAARARTLLVTEMMRDGWYAVIDGHRQPVVPAFGALMRVVVPSGASSVELRYRPTWRIALTALSAGAALLCTWLLFAWRPGKKKGPVSRAPLEHASADR